MQIVIELPKEYYEILKTISDETASMDMLIIKYGIPLPEHHGRLIDADWVKNTLDIYVLNEYNGQFIRRNDIDSVPTIIEADGGGEDEDSD